jgi:pimeloyl-ACP methyl ester carboxylesterase
MRRDVAMSTVSLGEIIVGYEDEGHGDPLVLVHGDPFNRTVWAPQVEWFSGRGHRVIAPDLRGYGDSSVVPGTTTLETFARDVVALLDHLGVERCVLGGLSMGAQIALECYRLFPDRVRGLVLTGASAAGETPGGRARRRATAERLLRDGRAGMAAYAGEMLPRVVSANTIHALPSVADHVLGMMRASSPVGAAAGLRGRAERRDYRELLPRIAVPTLVLVGGEDECTPVIDSLYLHERIPDARLTVIPGVGHLPNLERRTAFNTALQHFLDTLPVMCRADRP